MARTCSPSALAVHWFKGWRGRGAPRGPQSPGLAPRRTGHALVRVAARRWAAVTALLLSATASAATFTVNTTVDCGGGNGACGNGTLSLRLALLSARGGDSIVFDPATFPPNNPAVIAVQNTALPPLALGFVTVDGSNAGVILDGAALAPNGQPGIELRSGSNVVRGLQIRAFPMAGVYVSNGADGNIIGGGGAGQGNVLVANGGPGVFIFTNGNMTANNNQIAGNHIGVLADGVTASTNCANGNFVPCAGVYVWGNAAPGPQNNIIGGGSAAEGNLISGNRTYGVAVYSYAQRTGISNNKIGTNAAGSASLPNPFGGVLLGASEPGAVDFTTVTNNLIAGNGSFGLGLWTNSSRATVQGNKIGTDATGTVSLGNQSTGIMILSSPGNVIGGAGVGQGNLISGHPGGGIASSGTAASGQIIRGNFIGTDVTGQVAIPNGGGISLQSMGATGNIVGGGNAGEGNVISGNSNSGLDLSVETAAIVRGNYIGTDSTGRRALPNFIGVRDNAAGTIIGGPSHAVGPSLGDGNLVSGNRREGIYIYGGDGQTIEGNRVGTDLDAHTALPNATGISIQGASSMVVKGNVVGGNRASGIDVFDDANLATNDNVFQGNFIGTDDTLTFAVGNGGTGIRLGRFNGGNLFHNVVGSAAPNEIRNNRGGGILVQGAGSDVLISRNRYANNLPIALAGGNYGDVAPLVTRFNQFGAQGTLDVLNPNGTMVIGVEVYYTIGNGVVLYAGDATVDAMAQTWSIAVVMPGAVAVGATVTYDDNSTSALTDMCGDTFCSGSESCQICPRDCAATPQGQACGADCDCQTGFCVDGVCCNQRCGGGSGTDCIACSVATGAGVDGVCGNTLNNGCAVPNGTGSCNGQGLCAAPVACRGGFGDCNGSPIDGCEASVLGDPNACGGCGVVCSNVNDTPACNAGACASACNAGFANCTNTLQQSGCNVSLNTDAANCGGCNVACSAVNAMPSCAGGACNSMCAGGFGNCDGTLQAHGCNVGFATDAANCGSCGGACSANHVVASCAGGACVGACDASFADCNGDKRTDGCEINVVSGDTANCGGCGVACSGNHIAAACAGGNCAGTCDAGFADCNGNKRTDGCEVAVAADPANCGGCGLVCSPNHVPAPTCGGGACDGACAAGWGDCNANRLVDGCETPLDTLMNCGGCGVNCDDGNACTTDLCRVTGGGAACVHVDATACVGACSAGTGCGWTDSDGDGLNDTWETNGYVDVNCNGVNDAGIDTPLPGADPHKPNVYVKWDYMSGGGHTHMPSASAMAAVRAAYAGHDTLLGLFPASDAIAEHAVVSLEAPGALPACAGGDAVSFYEIKAAHFPSYLRPAYHYAVFAHYNTCDSDGACAACPTSGKSGLAPTFGTTGISELPGNDFIVSLGQLIDQGAPVSDLANAGTFMHELGHNLGLRHGGGDDLNNKPNYLSVMNYTYQFGIGFTASPGPYPTDTNDPALGYRIDYSSFTGGTLHEGAPAGGVCVSDGSGGMSEPAGLVGAPAGNTDVMVFYSNGAGQNAYAPSNGTAVDWDGTPPATNVSAYADVSGDGACQALGGFNDWAQSHAGANTRDTALAIGFQCNAGPWQDGRAPRANVEDSEATAQYFIDTRRVYPPLHVGVVVRPACGTHWVALASGDTVPVAALGSASFDAGAVDLATLRFAGAAATSARLADVDGDGRLDVVGEFQMNLLRLAQGATRGSLTGALRTSQAFGGAGALIVVAGATPPLVTKNIDIYEDDRDFAALHKKLSACTNPPVLPFDLADCVTAGAPCGGPVDVATVARITRVEFWANIENEDLGDARKRARALDEARDAIDRHGCAKLAITSPTTAALPFDELDDLSAHSSFYEVFFAMNGGGSGSCRVNLLDKKKDPAWIAKHPEEQASPLGCAVCVGSGCGNCASPAVACEHSTRECAAEQKKCRDKHDCREYQRKCTAACAP